MIKKILILTTILGTLFTGFHLEATYKMDASIYAINGKEIVLEDITGNLFSYYGDTSNLFVGKTCKVKFANNGTENNRYDDTIVSVKY